MDDDTPAAAAAAAAASSSSSAEAWSGASAVVSSYSASGPGRFVANLPPGYHFLPTDAELVLHYLRPRLANHQLPLPIFFDECILHYHPDRLIEKYREYGEDRWFFFTKRERKHEGGSRPNRATADNGHWNATGSPRRIRSGRALVGRVRTLVFYEAPRRKKKNHEEAALPPPPPPPADQEKGKADKGVKTEWTMYEYESLASEEEFVATCADGNAKMDVIVLCTIQKKKQKKKKLGEEGKEKRAKRKTKEKGQDQDDAQQQRGRSCASGKKKPRNKRVRGEEAPEEEETQAPPGRQELLALAAYTGGVTSLTDNDPNANTSQYCFFSNTSSPAVPVPTPPQETVTAAGGARGDNAHFSADPSAAAATESWQLQAPPLPAQVPYVNPKILAPLVPGGKIMAPINTWMDLHLANDQTSPPPQEELSTGSWIYPPLHSTTKIVSAAGVQFYEFAPALSNSNGFVTGGIGFSQNSAAAMVAQDEWWRRFSTQGSSGQS